MKNKLNIKKLSQRIEKLKYFCYTYIFVLFIVLLLVACKNSINISLKVCFFSELNWILIYGCYLNKQFKEKSMRKM